MVSQGIYSIVLLVFSNVFMTFAWYGLWDLKTVAVRLISCS